MTLKQSATNLQADFQGFEEDLRTWWQKFAANAAYWWHYATAWVNAIWLAVMGWWSTLGQTGQTDLVGSFLGPKWVTLFLIGSGVVANIIAKGWPQPVLAAKVEIKQVESMADAAAREAATPMPVRAAAMTVSDPGPDTIPAGNKPR